MGELLFLSTSVKHNKPSRSITKIQPVVAITWARLLSIACFTPNIDFLLQPNIYSPGRKEGRKEGRKAGRTPPAMTRARRMDIAHQLKVNKERKEGGGWRGGTARAPAVRKNRNVELLRRWEGGEELPAA